MAVFGSADSPRDHASVDRDLQYVALLVHQEFDDHVDPRAVEECLSQVAARFEGASVRSFIPLLVRRYAREELKQRLRGEPDPPMRQTPTPF